MANARIGQLVSVRGGGNLVLILIVVIESA